MGQINKQKSSKRCASNEHWMSEKRDKSVQGFHLTSGLNKAINQYENKH